MPKHRMIKAGKANINNRRLAWVEGEEIEISEHEVAVLKRGGFVGAEIVPEKKPRARGKK